MSLAWIILGAAALWGLIRLGRQSDRAGKGQWRVTATIMAAAAWGGAALAAMRGAWVIAAALAGAGLWLAIASRQRAARPGPVNEAMGEEEARRVLGVSKDAQAADIKAAYRRLMARAHPDAGGSEGLAERLNAARDRLLKR